MPLYAISYDLKHPQINAEEVKRAINQLAGHKWHCLEATWLLDTTQAGDDVLLAIRAALGSKDNLLVTPVAPGGCHAGFGTKCAAWLERHLPKEHDDASCETTGATVESRDPADETH
jgi:hypothetical protein